MLAHRGVGCSKGRSQQIRKQHGLRWWRKITEGAVGSEAVILLTPVSNQNFFLEQGGEAFAV